MWHAGGQGGLSAPHRRAPGSAASLPFIVPSSHAQQGPLNFPGLSGLAGAPGRGSSNQQSPLNFPGLSGVAGDPGRGSSNHFSPAQSGVAGVF